MVLVGGKVRVASEGKKPLEYRSLLDRATVVGESESIEFRMSADEVADALKVTVVTICNWWIWHLVDGGLFLAA